MTSRRDFFVTLMPVAGAMLFNARQAHAQAALDPKDAQAVALGYVPDAALVDKAKYPRFAAGQSCSTCQLYGGAAGSSSGPCPIYAGKLVPSKGWCSTWVKKA